MNPVVHFEMPCRDRQRVSAFYESVFGWKMQELGPEMGHYLIAHTAETGADGMPASPGTINGGFFTSPEGKALPPSVVLRVQGTDAMLDRALAAGAKRDGDVMDMPGVGRYAAFIDPEGNRVGMLTPDCSAPATSKPVHRQIFVNLPVADLPRSRKFFESLGYAFDPKFSNDRAACVVLGNGLFAMLVTRPFFESLGGKPAADSRAGREVMTCLTCESAEQLHGLVERALQAGGHVPQPPEDDDRMLQHGFEDLDGHAWALVWMKPPRLQG